MIDLTPLDVRKKSGDFPKALRGYEPSGVDRFLEHVAERMETLVKENMLLRERVERLQEQVSSQEGRERAVQEALVTAQELRQELGSQAQREAKLVLEEAESKARRMLEEAETQTERLLKEADHKVEERRAALEELERKRIRFLRSFRALLQRELDVVEVEEGRKPLEQIEVELDLGAAMASEPAIDIADVDEDPEGRHVVYPGDDSVAADEEEARAEGEVAAEVVEGFEVEEAPAEGAEVTEGAEETEEPAAFAEPAESTGPAGLDETEVVGDVDIRDLSPDEAPGEGEDEVDGAHPTDPGTRGRPERPAMGDEAEEWLSSILEHADEGERGTE